MSKKNKIYLLHLLIIYIYITIPMSLCDSVQCIKCIGIGLIKYDIKLCEICDGKKCIMCNSSGYEKMPWDVCDMCHGDGYKYSK